MKNYCTLFDSNYLAKGVVLIESLRRHSAEDFRLFVLAMDREVVDTLRVIYSGGPDNIWIVDLTAFEYYMKMAEAKSNRTAQEYFWTCASNLCAWLMGHHQLEQVTYLDADMMFFSDPGAVFEEIDDRSIAVIPHRLIPSKRHLEVNGQFNVSWVTFKNNEVGRECVDRWARQCRERCSASIGCGDQGYLDEWPDLYRDELCIIQNPGAGLAPWNLANFSLTEGYVQGERIVFFHAHEFEDGLRLTNYELRPEDLEFVYEPYLRAYQEAKNKIEAVYLQPR